MLTYVLAQCDMPQLDNEIQYMMELLDPSLLNGEGVCVCVCLFQTREPPSFTEQDAEFHWNKSLYLVSNSVLACLGGYYLTSAFGAMSLIRNFQEDQAAKMLSSETRNTLHQWHSRRTSTQRSTPSIEDFQV